eukprot:CAMPEP_0119147650 /NCGR_PEP_ID=MMETSP1310-20130426/40683_1 /TAXON_ID=464262 /ORGANISM="Genus nov. species nov., Strain RCC2339" /LENGTH=54 /DNA_ID=CAMNT_0007139631 /DNA_START=203 /DNA_END=367 /DNA_ORIENTATION=-
MASCLGLARAEEESRRLGMVEAKDGKMAIGVDGGHRPYVVVLDGYGEDKALREE